MALDPRRLTVLHSLADTGTVLGAASLLGITPSAVSQHLSRLERDVGVPLVDRSVRPLRLTPVGQLLAGRAERIAAELSAAERDLASLTGRIAGPVTVGAIGTAIRHVVAPAIVAATTRYPEIMPEVVETDNAAGLRQLRSGQIDLLIVESDKATPVPAPPGVAAVRLHEDPYRVVVPSVWPVPRSPRDLAHAPWVVGPAGSASVDALQRLGAAHGFTPRTAHICREFPPALALVAAGLGATIVPALALAETNGDGVRVTGFNGHGARLLTAIHRAGGLDPAPVVVAFGELLRRAAAGAAEPA